MITLGSNITKPRSGAKHNPTHPLSKGLVGHWLFNEGGGTVLHDISGNNNHGTLTNFALSGATSNWCGSPRGGGLNFDGTNDYIDCGNEKYKILTTTPFSISCWVNQTSNPANSLIITNRNVSVSGGWEIYFNGFASLRPTLLFADIVGTNYFGRDVTNALSLNTWYNVCFTYNGNGGVSGIIAYINGASVSVTDRTSGTANPGTLVDSGTLIGCRRLTTTTLNLNFPGFMDDIRIYNRALAANEVQQLYTSPYIDILKPKIYLPQ